MPLFYFDISTDVKNRDETGVELATVADAEREALRRASEFAADITKLARIGAIRVTVRSHQDIPIITVRLVCSVERDASIALGAFAP